MNRFKGIPSWAFARQKSIPSVIARFLVSVQSTDQRTLGYSEYCPGRSPDRRTFCLVFCSFRFSFSRQISVLSGIPNTVLGVRPTEERFVGCFVVFGIRLVDRWACSRVFRIPSWAFARQKSIPSGIARFSVSVQSTERHSLRDLGYRPGRSPDKRAKQIE